MMSDGFWFTIGGVAAAALWVFLIFLLGTWVHSVIWMDPDEETV